MGIFGRIEGYVVEPSIETVEQQIHEVGPSMMQFTCGAERGIKLVAPRFPVGVITAEKMGEVLDLGLAEGAGLGCYGAVPVSDFCSGKYVVTQFD
jgi:hypothetical protein